MSKTSGTEAVEKPVKAPKETGSTPLGPYDPPAGVTQIKVLRHEVVGTEARWMPCTRYETESSSLVPFHPLPDEPISEFILDRWGSGTYYPCWFGPNSKAMGRGKTLELQDPTRPTKSLQFGAPASVGAAASPTVPGAVGIAELLALLSNPSIASLLPQLQGGQVGQLELARLEAQRERDRREWEERRDRERREWDEDRARMRASEERRIERERQEAEDRRRRSDEEHAQALRAERRRHELELEELRESRNNGLDQNQFEEMFDELRTQLRQEIEAKEKSILSQVLEGVKNFAPLLVPQLQAMANGARPPAPPIAPPLAMPPMPPGSAG